jgi:hypothetical protein
MMLEFTVGINIAGERRRVTVPARTPETRRSKVKPQRPEAAINTCGAATDAPIGVIRTSRWPRTLRYSRRRDVDIWSGAEAACRGVVRK